MPKTLPWGKSATIDLYGCVFELVSTPQPIKDFIAKVIPLIGMQAYGPTYIDRFGEGEITGWSAMQFIQTSSITVHADEVGLRCFIDIFSCKDFDPQIAADFAKSHFKAKTAKYNSTNR